MVCRLGSSVLTHESGNDDGSLSGVIVSIKVRGVVTRKVNYKGPPTQKGRNIGIAVDVHVESTPKCSIQ